MTKHWYDYMWIVSLTYLVLGFFNILFAWLGLFCFFIPLIIATAKGSKGYCNRYCGRGQLFSLIGGRFGLSRKRDVPAWMKSKAFATASSSSFSSCSSKCSGAPPSSLPAPTASVRL